MTDEYEERAAIMEIEGAMPRQWAESLARLTLAPKPGAYTDQRWSIITEDACRLMRHLPKILRNGWTQADIRALLPHIKGREVIAIGLADVSVAQGSGPVRIFCRPHGDGTTYWTEGKRG